MADLIRPARARRRAAVVASNATHVFPLELDRRYPVVVSGDGAWVEDATGRRYLDAMSGGSMAATLGHGRRDIIGAAAEQASRLSYVHNERLTNPPREQLAAELVEVAPPGMTRVRFVTGGAEANEMAIQMARAYHVERGDPKRWQDISPAQAYHGPTMATLGLTGRPGLQAPFGPYMPAHRHIPPSTWRFGPSGGAALAALDQALAKGSRRFRLGHTGDGAPMSCAVGLKVLEVLRSEQLIERVRAGGPRLRDELSAALAGIPMVREVRGHGFLLGVEYVDPRDGKSFLPPTLGVARRIDLTAMEMGVIVYSTMPTRDGFAGDQTLFAPPFTTPDNDLGEMVVRFAKTVRAVAGSVERELR